MTLSEIKEYLIFKANSKSVIPLNLKFIFPEGIIILDGKSGNYFIHEDDSSPVDCAIYIDIATFNKIRLKKLNPILAYTIKKIKVKGNIDVAMKVISFI